MSAIIGLLTRKSRSITNSHATPEAIYKALDAEFHFTLDPCPLDSSPLAGAQLWDRDGLNKSWANERVFCNPPYDNIGQWLAKAREAEIAVYLLPSRTGTDWWHRYAMSADEIRFLRGRLKFSGSKGSAPFDSVVLVYHQGAVCDTQARTLVEDK